MKKISKYRFTDSVTELEFGQVKIGKFLIPVTIKIFGSFSLSRNALILREL